MTRLLWSEEGEISCEKHAPYRGSDSWLRGRWRPIRVADRVDIVAELGRPPQCETCASIQRRAMAVQR